jgi:hypothetical protein
MSSTTLQSDFQQHGAELFKELKDKARQLREPETVVGGLLALIEDGEALLASHKFPDAEKKYDTARSKLETVELSQQAERLAYKLLGIEAAYLVFLLLLAYGTYKWPSFALWSGVVNLHLQTAWFGALGGVTIAIYGIYEHIQKRDFDPKYALWYVCKPVIGAIFGWFIYLIYLVGFVTVQGVPTAKITTKEVPFLIAFLAGFSERFTLKLVDKLMSVLTTFQDQTASPATAGKTTNP